LLPERASPGASVMRVLDAAGSPAEIGYAIGAAAMAAGAFVAWRYGIDAERKMLEDIAAPLSVLMPRRESC
ncbi:MAG: hypothetical protein ABR591_13450, partial [Candidatus Velthaea sp.]